MKKGQRMGWGIQYDPAVRDTPDFDDRAEQLVLCYVTIDVTIVYAKMMVQPAGGWYPVVMLHPYGKYSYFEVCVYHFERNSRYGPHPWCSSYNPIRHQSSNTWGVNCQVC